MGLPQLWEEEQIRPARMCRYWRDQEGVELEPCHRILRL